VGLGLGGVLLEGALAQATKARKGSKDFMPRV
jgi:hypothetical protein